MKKERNFFENEMKKKKDIRRSYLIKRERERKREEEIRSNFFVMS